MPCAVDSEKIGRFTRRQGVLPGYGEDDQALAVLALAILFLWDCWLLAPDGKRAAFFSHDEYGIVSDLEGVSESVRDSLDKLGLLTQTEAD